MGNRQKRQPDWFDHLFYQEIRDNQLGWDLTDYGEGDFEKMCLLLFTIRNGNYNRQNTYLKGYAEKIMIIKENQVCPMHFYRKKREDIINHGGGNLSGCTRLIVHVHLINFTPCARISLAEQVRLLVIVYLHR